MKKYILLLIPMMLLLTIVTSCHDELDTIPLSSLSPENFWNNLEEGEIGINGVYDGLVPHYQQHYIKMGDHGSHVATSVLLTNFNQNLYAFYSFDNSDVGLKTTWATAYTTIYRANAAINRIEMIETDELNIPFKNRLIAEAKFLRALSYFNLVRFFGDVPLAIEELVDFDDISKVNRERTASSIIYDNIIEDLQFAEEHLYLPSWVSDENKPSYSIGELGRATVGAAKGLLAKVYLTRASYPLKETSYYQLAYDKAGEIIFDDAHYTLDADYTNLFTYEGETSQEWIFQIQYSAVQDQGSQWGGVHNAPGSSKAASQGFGRVSPTVKFTKSYEDGDLRMSHNIAKGVHKADGTIKYNKNSRKWYCQKYRFSTKPIGRFQTDMNAPVLRYADILLVFAEAAAELGMDNDAYDAVDMILSRAQAGGVSPALVNRALSSDDLKEFIFWERARELCFEGASKFDIVRAGENKFMDEVQGQVETLDENKESKTQEVSWSANVQPYHLLMPIPEGEMTANPSMIQNPGY